MKNGANSWKKWIILINVAKELKVCIFLLLYYKNLPNVIYFTDKFVMGIFIIYF